MQYDSDIRLHERRDLILLLISSIGPGGDASGKGPYNELRKHILDVVEAELVGVLVGGNDTA